MQYIKGHATQEEWTLINVENTSIHFDKNDNFKYFNTFW